MYAPMFVLTRVIIILIHHAPLQNLALNPQKDNATYYPYINELINDNNRIKI
jgi:hypothetical protein